jgi:hypothetical protein
LNGASSRNGTNLSLKRMPEPCFKKLDSILTQPFEKSPVSDS